MALEDEYFHSLRAWEPETSPSRWVRAAIQRRHFPCFQCIPWTLFLIIFRGYNSFCGCGSAALRDEPISQKVVVRLPRKDHWTLIVHVFENITPNAAHSVILSCRAQRARTAGGQALIPAPFSWF